MSTTDNPGRQALLGWLRGVPSDPEAPVYGCPLGRCTGRRPDNTTVFPLICAITGRELRQEIL